MRAVEIARSWIGTPYAHQASCRGAGADCLGLVRGVLRELGGSEPSGIPPYSPDWCAPSVEEALLVAARGCLRERPKEDVLPGRVLLFRMRGSGPAKHLGIASEADRFIHAYSGYGVVESMLTAPWRRKVVATFEFPQGDQ